MGDDFKEYRRSKPQQKLYKPGSGPLRRSNNYGFDSNMDVDNSFHESQSSINNELNPRYRHQQYNTRQRKPEQQLYVPKSSESNSEVDKNLSGMTKNYNSSQYSNRTFNKMDRNSSNNVTGSYSKGSSRRDPNKDGINSDLNYNRQCRQVSEPRSNSPVNYVHEQNSDRNRDSRSMEVSGHQLCSGGGKPPSGRRNSAGYPTDFSRHKHINLDNMPPRFRKKILEQSGHHSFESMDQINRDKDYSNSINSNSQYTFSHNQPYNPNWSQTLPSRGRGRLRDNENFDREKFISSYMMNYELKNSRRSTPSHSYVNLHESNSFDQQEYSHDLNPVGANRYENVLDSDNHDTELTENQKENKNPTTNSSLQNDIKEVTQNISNLLDMTNLDWTEEVEKNIKLEEVSESSLSFAQNSLNSKSCSEVNNPTESRESKRSGRRRRDKRSLSRGNKNTENKYERNRKDSNVSISQESTNSYTNSKQAERERDDSHKSNQDNCLKHIERVRRDSHRSNQDNSNSYSSLKHTERERRDSHRSNQDNSNSYSSLKHTERERRDSHRSNQNISNSYSSLKHTERERRDSHRSNQDNSNSYSSLKHTERERRDSHRSNQDISNSYSSLKHTERERRDSHRSNQDNSNSYSSLKHTERERRDSHRSNQDNSNTYSNLRQYDRERRDSHRSNRSSTLGNSRDDLDRWRSLRSYSREPSAEGRIVSQCNSRDTSVNRATCPRDIDGFVIPAGSCKTTVYLNSNQKKSCTPTFDPRSQSPAPNAIATSGEGGGGSGASGAGRGKRKGKSRRHGRNADKGPQPIQVPSVTTPASTNVNWREEILESKKHTNERNSETSQHKNRSVTNTEKTSSETSNSHPGILILPQGSVSQTSKDQVCEGRSATVDNKKLLYDYNNPSHPIIVQTNPSKVDSRLERGVMERLNRVSSGGHEVGDAGRAERHRALLQEVERADAILQAHMLRGPVMLADHWLEVTETRKCLQNALQRLLMSDLKYCQADNVEHHFWKILYYNFIEVLRKSLTQISSEEKPKIVKVINSIIEEGNIYFEHLVQMLEKTYKFNTDDYLNDNHSLPPKGLGYVGLALISVQKLYIFLGDLARYKEQVNETNNYAKSKMWYTKAQQINPKNGRPYNQLAILAIYAKRKLDAVYYYMRSLMSSNPFHSARESLISLFDENRKKYEAAERKRRVAAENSHAEERSECGATVGSGHGLRREVWVRPSGHRTTTLQKDTRDEHLANMTPVELNKSFVTSYLHVHGKLITKIGMETFHESASQMMREFRALLHRQPLPTPGARLLQLTALNMFAIETNASSSKDNKEQEERSVWLDCAVSVGLLMFGALLERCCALLPEPPQTQKHTDALLLLPAIKVWSDWMLCHSSIWNPPPSFDNFDIGGDSDPWDWLARLMNILENLDDKTINLEYERTEGHVAVRLGEDATLAGFMPLMYIEPAVAWVRAEPPLPHHAAEYALRVRKLLFFGTEYLVGVEPPVVKIEFEPGAPPRYVSAVKRAQLHQPPLQQLVVTEDSDDEESRSIDSPTGLQEGAEHSECTDEATLKLLRRKELLESRKASLERRRQRMQEILKGSWVSLEMEVRPKWLVPDTNCFIDHLIHLQAVAAAPSQPYQLVVPLVVATELEGLQKCSRLGESARTALSWMSAAAAGGGAGVRFATSRGSMLTSRAFAERDVLHTNNDDRVLATALHLHENVATELDSTLDDKNQSGCVRRLREVVLLTEDRNLRVKALAADLPARDLPSFVEWAGLRRDHMEDSVNK